MDKKWTNLISGTNKEIQSKPVEELGITDKQKPYPYIFEGGSDVLLNVWLRRERARVDEILLKHGAILFRGFHIQSEIEVRAIADAFETQVMKYTERTSPRTELSHNVYTSTEYNQEETIQMHSELSYAANWPMKIVFCCITPASHGGETPIADNRIVLKLLRKSTKRRLLNEQIKYIRNISDNIGLSWREIYQTKSRSEVEEFLRANNYKYEWKQEDHLKVEWVRPSIVKHPLSGDEVWFNHGLFYNRENYDHSIVQSFKEDDIPFLTFFGDNQIIDNNILKELVRAYEQSTALIKWERGDVLLLDNMLMSHGRKPFKGERQVLVSMFHPRFSTK